MQNGGWQEPTGLLCIAAILAGIAVFAERFVRRRRDLTITTSITCKLSKLNEYVISNCPTLTSYRPPFIAFSGHLHTILATFLPGKAVDFRREYFVLQDGGQLALDWIEMSSATLSPISPVLIILPGLTGSAENVTFLCHEAATNGFRVVVFNKRGHGKTQLTTPKLQGFGDPHDFRAVIVAIHARYPEAKLTAVGLSAGSGLLVSYCGEFGDSAILTAGVCISPGYDAVDLFLDKLPRLYEILLLRSLKRLVMKHSSVFADQLDMESVSRSRSFRDFDEHVYCKLYGYSDVLEYWRHNNPMRNIDNTFVPLLCISALDDPVCVKEVIPFEYFKEQDRHLLVAPEKGGHCAFLEGWSIPSWADRTALEYIQAVLAYTEAEKESGLINNDAKAD